ncbi:MAG: hypothetical protein M3040_11185 [Bacteroidota bacterium]|nr:hypothetical protein [Bacteroidota bacterium]
MIRDCPWHYRKNMATSPAITPSMSERLLDMIINISTIVSKPKKVVPKQGIV